MHRDDFKLNNSKTIVNTEDYVCSDHYWLLKMWCLHDQIKTES